MVVGMTDSKDSSPISPTVVVSVTDTNGGVYEIRYQRPGPVAQTDVEHDLWCLGEALAQREADVAEARVVPTDMAAALLAEQIVVVDNEITVSAMSRAGCVAMYGDDTSEQQRVLVAGPHDVYLHIVHHGDGAWTIDHDNGTGTVTVQPC